MVSLVRTDDGIALCTGPDGMPPIPVHPLWLRERCNDARSLDATTQQRLYNPADLPGDIAIVSVTETTPHCFRVVFSDGASGDFAVADILAELPDAQSLPEPAPWTAGMAAPSEADWQLCNQPATRLAALRQFLVHGYIIFNNVPSRPGAVLDVARRFGFPRETNFGALFDVRSVPQATDLAYTSLPLEPHTDNPYRHPVPGIQLLHCLTNETPGGLSTLVDGLAVAETLRETAPNAFAQLCRINVRFRYVDASTELSASAPLIELESSGRFAAIHHSPRLDFVPLLTPSDLTAFFAARRQLDAMVKSPSFERRFRLKDGDLMMFDNRRLLHGRTGFDPQSGLRHLQGCYIDSDGPRSEYLVLLRHLA